MAKRMVPVRKPKPIPPMICRSREDVTLALKAARECRGLSQSELDEHAGFNLGYTGKLEQPFPRKWPSGRCPLHPMFDIWIAALGVVVIIVPDSHAIDAKPIGAAVPPPRPPPAMTYKRAQRVRSLYAAKQMDVRLLAASFHVSHRTIKDILGNVIFPAANIGLAPGPSKCSHGHELIGENLMLSRIGDTTEFKSSCRTCFRESQKRRSAKKASLAKDDLMVIERNSVNREHLRPLPEKAKRAS